MKNLTKWERDPSQIRSRSFSDRDLSQIEIFLRTRPFSERDLSQNEIFLRTRSFSDRDLSQNETFLRTKPFSERDLSQNETFLRTRPFSDRDLSQNETFPVTLVKNFIFSVSSSCFSFKVKWFTLTSRNSSWRLSLDSEIKLGYLR